MSLVRRDIMSEPIKKTIAQETKLVNVIENFIKLNHFPELSESKTIGKDKLNQLYYISKELLSLPDLTSDEVEDLLKIGGVVRWLKEQPLHRYLPALVEERLNGSNYLNSPALTHEGERTEHFGLLKNEGGKSVNEIVQERILRVINYLRDLSEKNPKKEEKYQKEYGAVRHFFKPENVIGTKAELIDKMKKSGITMPIITRFLLGDNSICYENRGKLSGTFKCCPYCGKVYEADHFNEFPFCKVLDKQLKKDLITFSFDGKEDVYVLSEGFMQYILLPNVSEIHLLKKLEKDSGVKKVIANPKFDTYDLWVQLPSGRNLLLDTKDYQNPNDLIQHLTQRTRLSKLLRPSKEFETQREDVFIVISDFRIQSSTYNDYIKILNKGIKQKKLKAISESELFDLIKKEREK